VASNIAQCESNAYYGQLMLPIFVSIMILYDSDYEYLRAPEPGSQTYRVSVIQLAPLKDSPSQAHSIQEYHEEIISWVKSETSVCVTNILRNQSFSGAVSGPVGYTYGPSYVMMFENHQTAVLFKLMFGGRFLTHATIHLRQTYYLDKYLGTH